MCATFEQIIEEKLSKMHVKTGWFLIYPLICPLSQDLLKYTPHHHHDRSSLQTALTDLENVTHMLNERKRESEELFQSKKLQKMLNFKIPGEKQCRLVRQDDMEEVVRFWFLIDAYNF